MAFGFDNATIDAYDANLQAAWLLEDVTDAKGAYDLTNSNGVTFIAAKENNGANFVAASSQALEYASGIIDTSSDFTVNVWVNSDREGTTQYYLGGYNIGNQESAVILYWSSTGALGAFMTNTASTEFQVASGTGHTKETWYMVTVRKSGTTFEIFVNGSSVDTETLTGTMRAGQNFRMGCRNQGAGNSNFFDGRLDEGSYWDDDLSNAAITALWNGGTGRFYHEIIGVISYLTRTSVAVLDRTAAGVLERTAI